MVYKVVVIRIKLSLMQSKLGNQFPGPRRSRAGLPSRFPERSDCAGGELLVERHAQSFGHDQHTQRTPYVMLGRTNLLADDERV